MIYFKEQALITKVSRLTFGLLGRLNIQVGVIKCSIIGAATMKATRILLGKWSHHVPNLNKLSKIIGYIKPNTWASKYSISIVDNFSKKVC